MERAATKDVWSLLSQGTILLMLSNLVTPLDLGLLLCKTSVGSKGGECARVEGPSEISIFD